MDQISQLFAPLQQAQQRPDLAQLLAALIAQQGGSTLTPAEQMYRSQLAYRADPNGPWHGSAPYHMPGHPGTGARSPYTGTLTGGGF